MSTLSDKRLAERNRPAGWDICAYQQDWFSAVACRNRWRRCITVKKNNVEVARFPYAVKLRPGNFLFADAQDWAHICEPIISASLSQQDKENVIRDIIARLPRWISLRIVFNPRDNQHGTVAAFKAAGFTHTQQITYREHPDDPDVMDPQNKSGLDRKRRGNIHRAAKIVTITEDISADEFMAFYGKNLSDAGITSYYSLAVGRDLIAKGQALDLHNLFLINDGGERKAAKRVVIFAARRLPDSPGGSTDLVAAIACLCDERRCYYWITSRRRAPPEDKKFDDTVKLLVLHARKRARDLGLIFDADGVSTPGSHEFYSHLKFPREVRRDVFTRYSPIDSLLDRCRHRLNQWRLQTQRGIEILDDMCTPRVQKILTRSGSEL